MNASNLGLYLFMTLWGSFTDVPRKCKRFMAWEGTSYADEWGLNSRRIFSCIRKIKPTGLHPRLTDAKCRAQVLFRAPLSSRSHDS